MAPSIYDWSTTASNNSNADSDINWAEGQAPSTVNNSARQEMARIAEFLKDIGGSISAGGSANALTVTAGSSFTTYAAGRYIAFKATADNTGAATLNANSIGTKSIRYIGSSGDTALSAGMIKSGGIYVVRYSTTANSSAGGWILMNPTVGFGTAGNYNIGTSGSNVPLLDGSNTWSSQQVIGGAIYSNWSGGDIDSVLGASSSSGALIAAPSSTHLVVGIRENGGNDSFAVVSGGGNYTSDSTYDTLVAKFDASGDVYLGNGGAQINSSYFYVGNQSNNTPGVGNSQTGATWDIVSGYKLRISTTSGGNLVLNANSTPSDVADFRYNGTAKGSITVTSTNTTYNTTSDYRLEWKQGYRALEGSGAFIDGLKPYYFPLAERAGFIAHEFAEVSPASVTGEKDATEEDGSPKYQMIHSSSDDVIAHLVAEMQSLRKRIAALEAA